MDRDTEPAVVKALTLTQPWASLVATGAKQIETRSWSTRYRGPLAIHAARVFPKWARDTCYEDQFFPVLRGRLGTPDFDASDLPLGVVVAVVDLVDVIATNAFRQRITPDEAAFGDYSDGRYAWRFENVRRLRDPIGARGFQGLWTPTPFVLGELAEVR